MSCNENRPPVFDQTQKEVTIAENLLFETDEYQVYDEFAQNLILAKVIELPENVNFIQIEEWFESIIKLPT